MLKNPASTRRAALAACALAILLPTQFGPPCAARAQDGAGATQDTQSRPRRVTPQQPATTPTPTTTPPPAVAAPRAGDGGEEVGEDDVVRVDTELVSVPTVVTDRAGRPITNLRADDFAVFEDGRAQKIANFATTDAPFEVALLLDTSGSTRADVALIRRAAAAFIEALRPGDRVAVLAFGTGGGGPFDDSKLATVEVLTPLTDDREALRAGLERVGTSYGTPFYDGLDRIAREVFGEPARREVRGRRALVALTDGVDSTSVGDFEEARERLKKAGVVSYFVQINTEDFVEDRLMRDCADDGALALSRAQLERYRKLFAPQADASDYGSFCRLGQFERIQISRTLYRLAREEMDGLAKNSGGKTFPVADLRDARRAFQQVAAEIGTQYSLGYYSTNKARDGAFRTIRVQVRSVRDAQVRAREGYQAPRS